MVLQLGGWAMSNNSSP